MSLRINDLIEVLDVQIKKRLILHMIIRCSFTTLNNLLIIKITIHVFMGKNNSLCHEYQTLVAIGFLYFIPKHCAFTLIRPLYITSFCMLGPKAIDAFKKQFCLTDRSDFRTYWLSPLFLSQSLFSFSNQFSIFLDCFLGRDLVVLFSYFLL